MIDNFTIPLSKLLAWEGNVRKTDSDKGINSWLRPLPRTAFCNRLS